MKLKHAVLLSVIDTVSIIAILVFILKGIYYFFQDNDARCIEFILFGLVVNMLSGVLQDGIAGYLKSRNSKGKTFGEIMDDIRYGKEEDQL